MDAEQVVEKILADARVEAEKIKKQADEETAAEQSKLDGELAEYNEQTKILAEKAAQVLGKPVTGGSDAHSNQGIGIYVTVFERELESERQMLEELRAGRFYAGYGFRQGCLTRFSEESAARLPEVEAAGSDPQAGGSPQ